MARGFTLLELMITLVVLAIVLSAAAPNFSTVTESTRMKSLATELNGFVVQAKSEAVMRGVDLWAHIIMSGGSNTIGDWHISLRDSNSSSGGSEILRLSGNKYFGITVDPSYNTNKISFDAIHGRPKSGNIQFYPNEKSTQWLKLISHNQSARIRVCSNTNSERNDGIGYWGYETCV